MRRMLIALGVLWASPALAEPPMWSSEVSAETCASSYAERLADARAGIVAKKQHDAARAEAMPAIEWFRAHCRYLSDLEIAVRKLDDAHAFVCDTEKGRPANLTSELIAANDREEQAAHFMRWWQSDVACREHDAWAKRVVLVIPRVTSESSKDEKRAALLAEIDIMCTGDAASPKCSKLLAQVEPWRKPTPSPSQPRQ